MNGPAGDQLDRASATPDDIGADAALDDLLVGLYLAHVLVFRGDGPIHHHAFLADRDLGLFRGGDGRLDGLDLGFVEGALRLLAAHPDLVEQGDKILRLHFELLGQLMHSQFAHFPPH